MNYETDLLPQLDGNVSESSEEEMKIIKSLFSVKCETKEIIQILTFFRSFDFIWSSLACHKMCSSKSSGNNCFYCHMRSSCTRLNASRGRGPRSLKLIEFTSQLTQYQSLLGWNWMENLANLPRFVENTLILLKKHERRTTELFGIPELQCQKCQKIRKHKDQLIYDVDTSITQSETEGITLKFLIDTLIQKTNLNKCCLENFQFNVSGGKCVILSLSHPVPVKINHKEQLYGVEVSIKSFISQKMENGEQIFDSNFNFKDQMYCQNTKEEICKSDGQNEGIILLSFLLSKPDKITEKLDSQKFIFGTQLQKQLYKQYESVLNPEKHLKKKLLEKDYEKERNKDEQRIEYKQKIDQVRDKTKERREQHKITDQVRDKMPKRRLRDQTEERREEHKIIDKVRDEAKERIEKHKIIDQV